MVITNILPRLHSHVCTLNYQVMNEKTITILSKGFILLSAFSLLSVSLMAFFAPQSVMDLVQVKLGNSDAFSSIRGVYGGVGLTIVIFLLQLLWTDINKALGFLSLLWGLYALSRLITIVVEGPLGSFGKQWLFIELAFFITAQFLLVLRKRKEKLVAS